MNKSKTIYFLSAFVLIIGCYALNLSYSLFIDTQEKSILNANIPKLDSELSISSLDVEAGKEYLIKQTVTNIGTVAMNYAVTATSDVDTYTVKMAETEDNLSNGTLDINGSKDLYIVVSNTGEETITINFTLDKNYTTLTSKVPISNIVETTTVEYQDSFPYSDKPGTLAYHVINNFMNSDLYNPSNTEDTTNSDSGENDLSTLFVGDSYKLSLPVANPNPDSDTELDVPSPTTFTSIEENEVGLYKAEDDHGMSYYFRGASSVNYLNFAGMCWRIVRINGDGSVKLILEDRYATCDDREDIDGSGTADYKYTGKWSDEGLGYYFASDSNGKADFLNSEVANSFKIFQNALSEKINREYSGKNLSDKLNIEEWCYDHNITGTTDFGYDDGYNLVFNRDEATMGWYAYKSYGAYNRMLAGTPSLKCSGTKLMKFKDDTDMYVSTLTVDEIVFAGVVWNDSIFNKNSYLSSEEQHWWTISPAWYDEDFYSDTVFSFETNDSEGARLIVGVTGESDGESYAETRRSRPAVSLKPDIMVVDEEGIGTIDKPYVIE
ncbi:MAG: hypothetical protein IJD92_03215 [Bacilli bacterium]|nr:hypothetical protein [Bacilli bacterium]